MNHSLQKSHEKTERMLRNANDDTYEKACAVRPLFLKILRFYNDFKNEHEYTQYLQTAYNKAKEMLVDIDIKIQTLESASAWAQVYQYQTTYLKKFKKNLKNIKKLCEDTSITYYTMFPDNIPIDIRTHCVQFISQATI